jgi:hypothetical protein
MLVQFFRGMTGTRSFYLRYRIILETHLEKVSAAPPVEDFWLLGMFGTCEEIEECSVFYKIVEDHLRPPIGGDKVGRWELDERVRVGLIQE